MDLTGEPMEYQPRDLVLFDGLFGNFILGEVMLLCSRPRAGRKMLAIQMAYETAVERRIPTMLTATGKAEDALGKDLTKRFLDFELFNESLQGSIQSPPVREIDASRLVIDTEPHTPDSLFEACKNQSARSRLQLLIIAEIEYLSVPEAQSDEERGIALRDMLCRISRELRVGVLATVRLLPYSRGYPIAEDLKWPCLIEAANRAMLLDRPGLRKHQRPGDPRLDMYIPGLHPEPRARLWCHWGRWVVEGLSAESPF